MQPLITIIIPVYNVEPYLRRCLNSVLNQSYKQLEILLINDGSPDACPAICDEYAKKDERVRVLHQSNQGLAAARNAGLDAAAGDYIGFVDSDDFIHPEMMEKLYFIIEEMDAGIAVCGYLETTDAVSHEFSQQQEETFFLNRHDALLRLRTPGPAGIYDVTVCNKLYHRELFDSIRFPAGKYHEDEFVIYRLLDRTSAVAYTTGVYYYYFVRSESITHTAFNVRRLDVLEAFEEQSKYFAKRNAQNPKEYHALYEKFLVEYFDVSIKYYQMIKELKDAAERKKCRQIIRKQYQDAYRRYPIKRTLAKSLIHTAFLFHPSASVFLIRVQDSLLKLRTRKGTLNT